MTGDQGGTFIHYCPIAQTTTEIFLHKKHRGPLHMGAILYSLRLRKGSFVASTYLSSERAASSSASGSANTSSSSSSSSSPTTNAPTASPVRRCFVRYAWLDMRFRLGGAKPTGRALDDETARHYDDRTRSSFCLLGSSCPWTTTTNRVYVHNTIKS